MHFTFQVDIVQCQVNFSQIICVVLACSKKYTYDVKYNIHSFMHVVSLGKFQKIHT